MLRGEFTTKPVLVIISGKWRTKTGKGWDYQSTLPVSLRKNNNMYLLLK